VTQIDIFRLRIQGDIYDVVPLIQMSVHVKLGLLLHTKYAIKMTYRNTSLVLGELRYAIKKTSSFEWWHF